MFNHSTALRLCSSDLPVMYTCNFTESVCKFLIQAVSGPKKEEHKERVLWASFEYGDLSDLSMGHLGPASSRSSCPQVPLLLTLGLASGFSLWMINVSSFMTLGFALFIATLSLVHVIP